MKRCMVLFALGTTNWMYHSFNGEAQSTPSKAKQKAHQAPSTPTMRIKQLKQR